MSSVEFNVGQHILNQKKWTKIKLHRPPFNVRAEVGVNEMTDFCRNTFGYGRYEPPVDIAIRDADKMVWYVFVWGSHYDFFFKHETDASLFALRYMK